MRNKLVSGFIAGILLITSSSNVEAKPKQSNGIINGKQYIVLGGGPTAIPDNQISYIPCSSFDCNNINRKILEELSSRASIWSEYMMKLDNLTAQQDSCTRNMNTWSVCFKETGAEKRKLIASKPPSPQDYLRTVFSDLSEKSSAVRTDFSGNYSVNCPASKCLLFSNALAGDVRGYWIKLTPSNSKVDFTNSTLTYHYDTTKISGYNFPE